MEITSKGFKIKMDDGTYYEVECIIDITEVEARNLIKTFFSDFKIIKTHTPAIIPEVLRKNILPEERIEIFDSLNLPTEFTSKDYRESLKKRGINRSRAVIQSDIRRLAAKGKIEIAVTKGCRTFVLWRKKNQNIPEPKKAPDQKDLPITPEERIEIFDSLNLPTEFTSKDYRESLKKRGCTKSTSIIFKDLKTLEAKGKIEASQRDGWRNRTTWRKKPQNIDLLHSQKPVYAGLLQDRKTVERVFKEGPPF